MTITPYNLNSSLSRFNSNKNWSKILFVPDKKLQTTEIIELQDLINNQINKTYKTLYDFYTIVRGCKIIIVNITANTYECILTEGQVFLEIKNNSAFFIDIPSKSFSINRINTVNIGVQFSIKKVADDIDFRNPHNGGAAFGSDGADRIIISPEIIIQNNNIGNNAYPIAIIKPKTNSFINTYNDISDGAPEIIYYRNEELTNLYRERALSSYIKNLVELRLYESTGDFISQGLHININTTTNILSISPGVVYINGKRIETNYNNYFRLDPNNINISNITLNKQYLFYITDEGKFSYKEDSNDSINLLETPPNCLALGYLILNNRNNLILNYSFIEAPTRMPSINELINIEKSNDENNKELAELILKTDLLNLSSNTLNEKLNGIFTDSFNDLNNSDIFYPEYSSSILPAIQAISLPFTSDVKDNRNITLDTSTSNILLDYILNENNELVPYWATVAGTSSKLFNTERNITKASIIPISNINSILVHASPSIIYKSDESTFINYTNPTIKSLTGLKEPVNINTPFNDNSYNRNITIYSKGFPSLQNNIKVEINNVRVTNFNILKGSLGSTTGTIKADESGNVSFTFQIPIIPNSETFVVSLSYGNIIGSVQIQIIDPEIERVKREKTSEFINQIKYTYNCPKSGLAQTFTLVNPCIITGVECTIMDYPSILEDDLINVYITNVNSLGAPTETLAFGSLNISEVSLISNNSPIPSPSLIKLNKPLNLSRGTYAIVFSSFISGIKIGTTKSSEPRLIDGQNYFYDPLKLQVFKYTDSWTLDKSIDNIACDLILHNPSNLLSSTIINIEANNGEPFDLIDINLSIEQDISNYIELFILDENQQYKLVENGSFFFKKPILFTKLKINVKGTNKTHPILNLDNLSINLINTKLKGVWISKNQEYETPYNSLNLSLDIYKPNNTTYKFFFSSNKGVTWEELLNPLLELVNETLPIYKYTFNKNNLGFVVLNSEENKRYNLRYKIEFNVSNLEGIHPFFKNLVSITSP